MPIIRRRSTKKPAYRRKRYVKASLPNRRVVNYSANKGHLSLSRKLPEIYVRNTAVVGVPQSNDPTLSCLSLGTPIADAVGGTYSIPFAMKFRLDQLINYTDITNIADQYKLKYVKVGLTYQSSTSTVSSNTIMPNLQWIADNDDATPPASINDLREKMGVRMKTFGFNKMCSISLRPLLQDTVGGAGGVVQNSQPRSGFINTSFPNTEHFGLKGILSNVVLAASPAVLTSFKIDVTAYVSAKDFQ